MNSDQPTLTQVQILQSPAEALSWFEKEVGWGVSPARTELVSGPLSLPIVAIGVVSITRRMPLIMFQAAVALLCSAPNSGLSSKRILCACARSPQTTPGRRSLSR